MSDELRVSLIMLTLFGPSIAALFLLPLVDLRLRKEWKTSESAYARISAKDALRPAGESVKKRIAWYPTVHLAVVEWQGKGGTSRLQWRESTEDGSALMVWDGVQCEKFISVVALKSFIIRMVYDIDEDVLIPSELLAEGHMIYATGDWVDEWGCRDENDEIIECESGVYRPPGRALRAEGRVPRHWSAASQSASPKRKPGVCANIDMRWSAPKVEIPDIECFYTFRAGGYYEKNQDPLESSCEKGETTV